MQQDVRVERGNSATLGRVEGNLKVEKNATIEAADGSNRQVTVAGSARFRGDCTINCDFECRSLKVEKGTLRVAGNLLVHGDVDVENALYVDGSIAAEGGVAGGGIISAGSIKCRVVRVGGTLKVSDTLDAESVKVGGKVIVQKAMLVDLSVGGQAEIGSGAVQGQIRVGGTLLSKSELEFDSITVGGRVELGTAKGRGINVGGRLATTGDLACEKIKVGGIVEVGGNCSGATLEVGGETRVAGSLALTGKLGVGGDLQVKDTMTGADIGVGGRFKAGKAILTGWAWIGGQVETGAGLKAGGGIKIASHAECKGPLVGGMVELGKRCKVQDVYGSKVVAGKGAEAEKIVADEIEIHDGCTVGQTTYTRRLETGRNVTSKSASEKVASLPAFPL
ncbi:hypothetical protein NTE_00973 [Candidatus Nitrososphaera evergladensis SR1]|uniref:Integral membrane protein CcmA involved in cell shape determination n=1 Tax=Candidatus Nitrososphaera evergladensis SR1 TaxID=1459636 RepID=A0A075MPB1_9ARCH|nr:hypothetical protein [Candidatus Nitrososphaera evergladensis]AIF83048.1 hypothetical protein NTE_00973 [Candidatus Nitrososphaera evergladensis SR1]